ncbi:MAG: hypothetical protein Q8P41_00740 [Pseudomonadota bacterium]|nr:hypothetical protein [Pseudomonadota bacterium]
MLALIASALAADVLLYAPDGPPEPGRPGTFEVVVLDGGRAVSGADVALLGPDTAVIAAEGEIAPGRYQFRYQSAAEDASAALTVRVDDTTISSQTVPLAAVPAATYGVPAEVDAVVGTPRIEVRFPRLRTEVVAGARLARASEGRVLEVRDDADGVVVVVEPGGERNARMLAVGLIDLEDPRARPAFALVRLRARPQLTLTAEPGSTVSVRIGKRSYGPFVADAAGAAAVSFDAWPGESAYEITVSDDLGNTQRSQGPLPVVTRPVLVGVESTLADQRGAELWLGAWTPTGAPWTGPVPLCRSGAGVRSEAAVAGRGVYRATVSAPAAGALFDPRVECGLADASVALRVPLGAERPDRIDLRVYPETLSADFPIAQVQAALLDRRGERVPPDALRLRARVGELQLEVADGAVRGEYRGAAAVEAGGDTLSAAWDHPAGAGLAWALELHAAADTGDALVTLVRARDRQDRPLAATPVRVWLGELAVATVTDARGWARVVFPALPPGPTIVRAETADGVARQVAWLPGAPQVLPDPTAPDLVARVELPIRAGRVRQVFLDVSPRPLRTGSGATAKVVVRMLDGAGNAVVDEPVTISASVGDVGFVETQADGTRVTVYRPPSTVLVDEVVRITATTSAGTVSTDLELSPRPVIGSLGVSAGWISNLGVVSTPALSLTGTHHLGFLPRLLSVRVGVTAYAFETVVADPLADDIITVNATMVPFDIGLSATERWGRRSLTAGLAAVVAPYAMNVDYGDDRGVAGIGLASPGLAVMGGGGYRLGNSEIYAEARLLLFTVGGQQVSFEGSLGGASLMAGYRLLY